MKEGFSPINKAKGLLSVGILLVIFIHMLLAAVQPLIPILIVLAVMAGIYNLIFKRPF